MSHHRTIRAETTTEAKDHSEHVQHLLSQLSDHLKYDIKLVDSARFQALAETTREVLGGLKRAFQHFSEGHEKGWGGNGNE
jgi:hypothetical protein